MTTISLKVPETLLQEIKDAAVARGVPKSAIIRESLETTLRASKRKREVSCLDLMGKWVGQVSGPIDASTNPRYLDEALLSDHGRGNKKRR